MTQGRLGASDRQFDLDPGNDGICERERCTVLDLHRLVERAGERRQRAWQ